jgi:alkaline phosphatase D
MSGDVTDDSAIIWSRTDRPCRMLVEWSTDPACKDARARRPVPALPSTDFTARVDLRELPSGQDIFYRVTFIDLSDARNTSEPVIGHLKTGPGASRRNVTFVWGGDVNGQGWGINPDWGGLRMFETMRKVRPDFFIHSGDTIYADGPILPEVRLPDGTVWKNRVIPGIEKVAETLEEFRARYRYNTMDEHLRRFHGETAAFMQWDDHEVRNNWWPGQKIPESDTRYKERSVDLLAAYGTQAFFENSPIRIHPLENTRIYRSARYGPDIELFILDERSYRGPNSSNLQTAPSAATHFLGPEQMAWLKQGLRASKSTWKLIASDMPVSLCIADPTATEGWANNDGGGPKGRELELAEILRFIKSNKITNVIWLTADVHYAAAHYYEPSRGALADFTPFWEFVAGPLHAGTFGPGRLDPTFGPTVKFNSVPNDLVQGPPPSAGLQFFGLGRLDAATRVLTIELRDLSGARLYSVDLEPSPMEPLLG